MCNWQASPGNLQLHPQSLVHLQCLPDAQVLHDFQAATWNHVRLDISVQSLNLSPLATPSISQTTEDLSGLSGAELKSGGGLGLEAGDGTAETQHGFRRTHHLALV